MKVILVTGGAGFIGSNLIESLLKDKKLLRVICVDNLDGSYDPRLKRQNVAPFRKDRRFRFYKADIRNEKRLRAIFRKERPEAVVHLAAKTDTRRAVREPREYVSNNIAGTLNLLECAREFGVTKFIFASSSSVYGNKNKAPFKENALTDFPISPYGASKKAGEALAYTYHHNFGLPVVCLRIFNAYGRRMRPGLVLYAWTKNILAGKPVEMSGRGVRRRDYTHVDDLVRAVVLALKKNVGFAVLNVGNARPLTLAELLRAVEKAAGRRAIVVSRPSHHSSVELTHASTAKARRMLGWRPKVDIEKGVRDFVSWFARERLKQGEQAS